MRPQGLNHAAYVTWDTAATARFYAEVLGMRLVGHALGNEASTGPTKRFLHTFFEMGDGSCLAFFEIEGVAREDYKSPVPVWARHIALSVGSEEELQDWLQRLRAHNVEFVGPKDHEGVWTSVYFFDPNGIRLELTYQKRPLGEADAVAAQDAVHQWATEHHQAALR